MKILRCIILFAVIVAVQPAIAQIETLINAVETAPSNIILPASNSGMMTFRPCADECDKEHERVRVTPESRFVINGAKVKWEDFRKEFPTIRQLEKGYALVSYDTKNNTLVSLEVSR